MGSLVGNVSFSGSWVSGWFGFLIFRCWYPMLFQSTQDKFSKNGVLGFCQACVLPTVMCVCRLIGGPNCDYIFMIVLLKLTPLHMMVHLKWALFVVWCLWRILKIGPSNKEYAWLDLKSGPQQWRLYMTTLTLDPPVIFGRMMGAKSLPPLEDYVWLGLRTVPHLRR